MGKQGYKILRVLFTVTFLLGRSKSESIKLFKLDVRISGVFKTYTNFSLLKCSVHYDNIPQSLSFNYNSDDQICELSSVYPESATADIGWKVYGRIVDGSWGNWLNWGACSVTCGDGTRSRSRSCNNPSPSNGGEQCQGSNVNSQNCNIKECNTFVNGFLLSEDVTTWASAKAACEALSARLVILESQKEIDDIMTSFNILGFDHWIGMTCTAGSNCVWIDGRSVSSGFQAWAPNEPNWGDCVYIGMSSKLWDDTGCTVVKRYICEQI